MEDCWEILGLDRDTATEKDVKAAYASLLRVHRPDHDPDGFRKVRAAYEEAMRWLLNNQSGDIAAGPEALLDASPGWGGWPGFLSPAPDARALLASAMASQKLEELEAAFERIQKKTPGWWSTVRMAMLLRDNLEPTASAWVVERFRAQDVLEWMEAGRLERCRLVLAAWEHAGDSQHAETLIDLMVQKPAAMASEDAVTLGYELASWYAFWSEQKTHAMADVLFLMLPPRLREDMMDALDEKVDFGRLFLAMKEDARRVWWMHLRLPYRHWDWGSASSQQALSEMAEGIDDYIDTFVEWEDRIPPHAWDALWGAIEASRARMSRGMFDEDSFWFRSHTHTWIGVALLVIVVGALMVGIELLMRYLRE
ncbi:J domain-containing protein [Roseimicrobium sp. ORNL1]|uniref:J domain-containing protein n=1 Tax=Roseimicrobium sp. ORNL1 TaxID=2711231 RepID=UPI0013E151A1|nr:J domain-containing protein [Roseimicrobium sp. ORNL1]QIF04879.1 J domain-containing protein [Roseimicrobium sp. ORNL1]